MPDAGWGWPEDRGKLALDPVLRNFALRSHIGNRPILACLAVVVACASRAAPPEEEASRSASAIVGGRAAPGPSPVVSVGTGGVCTGTFLAPNLVLIAKHCVTDVNATSYHCAVDGSVLPPDLDASVGVTGGPDGGPGSFGAIRPLDRFTVGATGKSPYAPRVVKVLVPPSPTICAGDVALLVLDRGVDDPITAPVRLDRGPAVGDPIRATGWGVVSGRELATQLEERDVHVTAVGPAPSESASGGVRDAVPPGYFEVDEALCHGDSGSPALLPSGAVVGVASGIDNPAVPLGNGSSADCSGPDARGIYQALAPFRDFVLAGFAEANAVPWLDGEPDPRAALAGIGVECTEDAACRSNACAAGPDGRRTCVHGCIEGACDPGASCQPVDGRLRCVPGLAPAPAVAPAEPGFEAGGGCAASPAPARGGVVVLAALALLLARRRQRAHATRAVGTVAPLETRVQAAPKNAS